ncbi:MAG: TrbC/VirB2 family protein [Thermus sp.]|uniref:TrbC/VirB2 family protein n=1 Tax=Thermus sp. TaxID=275 RepID=UPI003D103E1F
MKAVLAKAKRFLGTEHGRFLALALAAGLMLFLGVAEAETNNPADQAFGNVANAICTIVSYLKGPVGLGIIILMFAVGGISLAIGGRNAMPLMIGAGIGGIIVAAAPFFAKMFFGGTVSANNAPACSGLF